MTAGVYDVIFLPYHYYDHRLFAHYRTPLGIQTPRRKIGRSPE